MTADKKSVQKPTALFDRVVAIAQRHKNNAAGGLHVVDEFVREAVMSVALPVAGTDPDTAECIYMNHREDMLYVPRKLPNRKQLHAIEFYDLRNGLVLNISRNETDTSLNILVDEMSSETERKIKQNAAHAYTA